MSKDKKPQLIHIMDEKLGMIDWELPKSFGERLEVLHDRSQQSIKGLITAQLREHLELLVGALNMREKAEDALNEIHVSNLSLAKSFLAQISK